MPVVNPPVENPYSSQLKSFTGGISNARRGLTDLYKLRRKGLEGHYNEMGKLYGGASVQAGKQYDASIKALGTFQQQGLDYTRASGYGLEEPGVTKAVRDIVGQATSPYASYLGAEGKAQRGYFKAIKGAEQYEDKTLKTGLAREQPAALSELEQGIVDTQSNLQTQAGAFAQQQAYNQSMQGWMNQMLGYQRQAAMGAGGSAGGGGSGKESPNTAQWQSYASPALGGDRRRLALQGLGARLGPPQGQGHRHHVLGRSGPEHRQRLRRPGGDQGRELRDLEPPDLDARTGLAQLLGPQPPY